MADGTANTDTETQSVTFGEGFDGLTDLKVGQGDGYLYALSISDGAVYRILPRTSVSSFSNTPAIQGLEKEGEILTEPTGEQELEIPFDFDNKQREDINEDKEDEDIDAACDKLANRIDQISEQESRGGLNEQQARELDQRIQSTRDNLGCA